MTNDLTKMDPMEQMAAEMEAMREEHAKELAALGRTLEAKQHIIRKQKTQLEAAVNARDIAQAEAKAAGGVKPVDRSPDLNPLAQVYALFDTKLEADNPAFRRNSDGSWAAREEGNTTQPRYYLDAAIFADRIAGACETMLRDTVRRNGGINKGVRRLYSEALTDFTALDMRITQMGGIDNVDNEMAMRHYRLTEDVEYYRLLGLALAAVKNEAASVWVEMQAGGASAWVFYEDRAKPQAAPAKALTDEQKARIAKLRERAAAGATLAASA